MDRGASDLAPLALRGDVCYYSQVMVRMRTYRLEEHQTVLTPDLTETHHHHSKSRGAEHHLAAVSGPVRDCLS